MEHLEHVPRRIRVGITRKKRGLDGIRGILGSIIRDFGNLMAAFDRAPRVVLRTSLEHLEHVPRRIRGEITSEKCGLGGYSKYFPYYNKRFWKSDGTVG